jgi:hypothetical protein
MMIEDFLWKGLLIPEDGVVRDRFLERVQRL